MLYFIAGRATVSRDDYDSLGLDYLKGTSPSACGCARGPGKEANNGGVVFEAVPDGDTSHEKVGYYPDAQTWKRFKFAEGSDLPEIWIGFANDKPRSGPEELKRAKQYPGHLVTLEDGNEWLVPAIQRLPQKFALDENGAMVSVPMGKYGDVIAAANRFYGYYFGISEVKAFPFLPDGIEAAAEFLALNYHVSAVECLALELFGSDSIQEVLRAAIDMPTIDEKKKVNAEQA